MLRKYLLSLILCFGFCTSALAHDITFNLYDQRGVVTEKNFEGKYLLLTLGYTSCPDICPTTLYEYGLVMKSLKNPENIVPIFVTIDPVNDEIERLHAYTQFFDERIVGLSGEMQNIQNLAEQLGATFGYRQDGKKVENPQPGQMYTVYHSALVYLISPDRELLDVYDYQMGAKNLTEALDKVLSKVEKQALKTNFLKTSQNIKNKQSCPLPENFVLSEKNIQLSDILPNGTEISHEKPTLLNIWALWCAPCRKELPLLDEMVKTQNSMDIQTLNLGDKPEAIARLYHQLNIQHLPANISSDRALLSYFDARGLPFTAIFWKNKLMAQKGGIISKTDDIINYAQCITNNSSL